MTFELTAAELEEAVTERDKDAIAKAGGHLGIADKLKTDPKLGLCGTELSEENLTKRKEAFGVNEFEYPPPKSFLQLCRDALDDLTVQILCVAAIISLGIGAGLKKHREEYGYLEGIAIVLVVFVVVFLQAYIDYVKEQKFRQLNSIKDNYAVKVVRNGEVHAVTAGEVLVGDVVELSAGDKIPADGVFLEGSKLRADEAAMTGEPIGIAKSHDKDPFLLSGTTISEGSGRMAVVAVGSNSQWGVILKTLIVDPSSTPLQDRLDVLVVTVGNFGIGAAIATFVASMIRWIVNGSEGEGWDGVEILDYLINSVTIVVVAIPEGLPLAITLGLAFAMRKMMADQNLVRRLEACETMGSATQLNADKTGTLTQNRMTVTDAYLGGTQYDSVPPKDISDEFAALLAESVCVNSDANLAHNENGTIDHIGSKTECALLQMVEDLRTAGKGNLPASTNFAYVAGREKHEVAQRYHFTSARKRMSTAVPMNGGVRLHVKGASEIVVKLCTKMMQTDGSVTDFSADDLAAAEKAITAMASTGLRTLCIAYVDLDTAPGALGEEPPEANLTLLGVAGIKDPIRPETAEAVRLLRQAGVVVRMVTGDNKLTAEAIAREAGILEDGDDGLILEGPVFRKMSQSEKEAVAVKIRVLARSSPADKLTLCNLQKSLGEVVSVTGDGTNDAPALKDADVGFALGIAGTEIAKEACDIVILDDNIASMAKAVLWGRNVFQSIRKFLQFQLVVNVVAVSLNFISAAAGITELPLAAVPLLWVNMIMDSMGALALATEPPSPHLMERKPFGRSAPLVNREMWRNIVVMSVYQLIVCLVLLFAGQDLLGIDETDGDAHYRTLRVNSVIFNTFVFMQIFSEINSRKITEWNVFEGIQDSPIFCFIIFLTIGTQAAFIEGVGRTVVGPAIGFMNLTGGEWAVCIVIGFCALPVGFIARQLPLDIFPGMTDEEAAAAAMEEKKLAVAAANAAVSKENAALSAGDVNVNIAAKKRWSKVRNVMHAYSAFMAPLTVPIAESRERARGRSLSPTVGDEGDFLAAGLPSPVAKETRTKSTEFRTVPPGSETSVNMK
jgi:Ca2+-transporting ATPase|tara:strand:- start:12778 stop:15987 length:3210 start_codon:yes stop_codon:yes gene_type:complete